MAVIFAVALDSVLCSAITLLLWLSSQTNLLVGKDLNLTVAGDADPSCILALGS